MSKPRVAFFDFASCEGCQLQVVNLEEAVVDLVGLVEVVSFREAMKEHSDEYDIAFIEGSIHRPIDEERVKQIRERASILVAFGACACMGGVLRLGRQWTSDENKKVVYGDYPGFEHTGDDNELFEKPVSKAVDEVVKVDAYIPGCPIDRTEFVNIVKALLMGKVPKLPEYPVCVECKKNENECVFTTGGFCLGPVTRGGCGAICPEKNIGCEGCRGPVPNAETNAQLDVLKKYGLTTDEIMVKNTMFCYRYNGGEHK